MVFDKINKRVYVGDVIKIEKEHFYVIEIYYDNTCGVWLPTIKIKSCLTKKISLIYSTSIKFSHIMICNRRIINKTWRNEGF